MNIDEIRSIQSTDIETKERVSEIFCNKLFDEDGITLDEAVRISKIYNKLNERIESVNEIARKDIQSEYLEKGDTCYNLDNWNPDGYNILYITGISGSGKTTLAKDLAKEFNCYRVELDNVAAYYLKKSWDKKKNTKFYNELKLECPDAASFIDEHPIEVYGLRDKWKDTIDILEDFADWFSDNYEGNGKLYIVNGAFVIDMHDYMYFADRPLILKDINLVKTVFRRTYREILDDSNDTMFNKIHHAYKALKTGLTKSYRDANKDYKNFKKKLDVKSSFREDAESSPSIQAYKWFNNNVIHNKFMNTGILYHGSHNNIKGNYIEPKNNSHEDDDYVFMSSDRNFSLCYSGNPWSDSLIRQGYYNNRLYLVEMKKGMFDKVFNTDGYIYEIIKEPNFFQRGMKAEFLSRNRVKIVGREYIRNVMEEILVSDIDLYRYPNKPRWWKKYHNESVVTEAKTSKFKKVIENPTVLKRITFDSLNRPDEKLHNVLIKEYDKEIRGRSEVMIFRGDSLYISFKDKGYELPGGGWEEGEDHAKSAQREAEEEVCIKTKNIKYVSSYAALFDPPEWCTWAAPKKHWWYGEYTELYIAEYDGKYKGYIKKEDRQDSLKNNSKFYKISEIYDKLLPIHQKAVDTYRNDQITNESAEETSVLDRIKEFNKELNGYDYGIPSKNGKIDDLAPQEFFKKYRLMSPEQFKKNRGGVCWDFVQYQDWYFKKNFPEVKVKNYYIIIDDLKNCPTHTFTTFSLDGKYYWFESSWGSHRGVHEYDSEKDLINDVIYQHNKSFNDKYKYPFYIKQFSSSSVKPGMNVTEYMDAMSKGIKKISIPKKPVKESVIEEATGNNISYSKSFKDVKDIVDTFSKEELSNICNGTFKNSPYVKYREVLLVNGDPAAFIDVYSIPSEMEKDEAAIVCGCKKEYRGNRYIQNLGTRMLKKIKSTGIKKLYWETKKSNIASSTNAKKLGFTKSEDINDGDDNYSLLVESYIEESYVQYKSGFEKKPISFNYKAYDINSKEAKPYIESNSFTKKYLDYLSDNTGEVLVDTDNNKLIGYIFVGKSKDKGFISTLVIEKEYRGYGFGTILIKDAIDKYNAIDLVVYKDNKVALEMYKKLGFIIVGEDKNGKAWYMKLKSYVNESKDASTVDKDFKKKSGKSFKYIDMNSDEALKYVTKDWRNNKSAEIAVCVEDDKLAGFVYVNKSGTIAPMKVLPEYRGYGISNILFKDAVEKMNGKKLGVYSDNQVAIKLYKKFGFVETGRKQYKDGDEVIIMEKQ